MGNAVAYGRRTKQANRKKQQDLDVQRKRERIQFSNHLETINMSTEFCEPTHAGTSAESYVKVNVGGKSYCVRTELYTERPTKMHRFVTSDHEERMKICDSYDEEKEEYYFERNSKLADHLMDFFSTGSLHRPNNVCAERFKQELDYWEISYDQLASCCAFPSTENPLKNLTKLESVISDDYAPIFDGAILGKIRLTMWKFLEEPQSSVPAAIFAVLSVVFVFTSVFGLILGSMPEFQEDSSMAAAYHNMHNRRSHANSNDNSNKFERPAENALFPSFVYKPTDNPMMLLVIVEYVCIGWFTFEYLLRYHSLILNSIYMLSIYPQKIVFMKTTLNLIDLFTILPFYLELCLPLFGVSASKFKDIGGDESSLSRGAHTWMGAMLVIRVLRVLRMARVFKLARYSTSLQTFGHTLKSSITELSMLSMFLLTGIIFFSTIMYYLEKDELNTDFYSIPAGCWWCVVTMATVGYGDAKPVTTCGKLVATATSICGIIVLAFPISMIVEKFASAQQKAIEDTHLMQAQMSAAANNYLLRRFPTRRRTVKLDNNVLNHLNNNNNPSNKDDLLSTVA